MWCRSDGNIRRSNIGLQCGRHCSKHSRDLTFFTSNNGFLDLQQTSPKYVSLSFIPLVSVSFKPLWGRLLSPALHRKGSYQGHSDSTSRLSVSAHLIWPLSSAVAPGGHSLGASCCHHNFILPCTSHTTSPTLSFPVFSILSGEHFSGSSRVASLDLWWGDLIPIPPHLLKDFIVSENTPLSSHVKVLGKSKVVLIRLAHPPGWQMRNQGPKVT